MVRESKGDGGSGSPSKDSVKDRRSSDGGMGLLRRLELLSKRSHEGAHGSHAEAPNRRSSTMRRLSTLNRGNGERRSSNRCVSRHARC